MDIQEINATEAYKELRKLCASSHPTEILFAQSGGPIKRGVANQYYDNNTIYNILPDETDSDPSITQHVYLPNVTVTAQKPKVESANDPVSGLSFLNDATLGMINRLSPTQNIRAIKDTFDSSKSGMQKANSWIQGNNGIVTDKFADNHPILANAANLVADAGMLGVGNAMRPVVNRVAYNLRGPQLRANLYTTRLPFGYDGGIDTAKKLVKNIFTKDDFDIENPVWKRDVEEGDDTVVKARIDSFRKYNLLPQKYNTFVPSETHPGSFTAKNDIKKLTNIGTLVDNFDPKRSVSWDFVNGSGGHVALSNKVIAHDRMSGNTYGVLTTNDLWDVQPGSALIDQLAQKTSNPTLQKLVRKILSPFSNFEVGQLTGSKPFRVINEVPYTRFGSGSDGLGLVTKGFFPSTSKSIQKTLLKFAESNPHLDVEMHPQAQENYADLKSIYDRITK